MEGLGIETLTGFFVYVELPTVSPEVSAGIFAIGTDQKSPGPPSVLLYIPGKTRFPLADRTRSLDRGYGKFKGC